MRVGKSQCFGVRFGFEFLHCLSAAVILDKLLNLAEPLCLNQRIAVKMELDVK